MVNRVQTIRYYTSLQRPPTSEFSGELYINYADIQIGALDLSHNPVDFVAVRYYSQLAKYVEGDYAIYNGTLYRCIEDTVIGPFDSTRWVEIVDLQEINILIAVETTRAEGAETTLQTNINTEIARAEAEETVLQNEINAINAKLGTIIPPGVSADYYGLSAPTGWLLEDGTIYSVSTYPALGALLGSRFGGDGVTTFAVPNSTGRFGVASSTAFPFASTGGSTTITLGSTNLPSHTHTIQPHIHTSASHTHVTGPSGYAAITTGVDIAPGFGGAGGADLSTLNTGPATPVINPSVVLTTDATGTSAPITTLPPYISRTRIIKT